jgi:hypothetical protein
VLKEEGSGTNYTVIDPDDPIVTDPSGSKTLEIYGFL